MKKILVVDDEEDLRDLVATALRQQGFEVVVADNGIDAYNLAKSTSPDLVISDVMMYTGSGFILHEFLKRDDRTASIPLILMTGNAQTAGAWGSDPEVEYLEKPFPVDDLLAIVEKKLGSGKGK